VSNILRFNQFAEKYDIGQQQVSDLFESSIKNWNTFLKENLFQAAGYTGNIKDIVKKGISDEEYYIDGLNQTIGLPGTNKTEIYQLTYNNRKNHPISDRIKRLTEWGQTPGDFNFFLTKTLERLFERRTDVLNIGEEGRVYLALLIYEYILLFINVTHLPSREIQIESMWECRSGQKKEIDYHIRNFDGEKYKDKYKIVKLFPKLS